MFIVDKFEALDWKSENDLPPLDISDFMNYFRLVTPEGAIKSDRSPATFKSVVLIRLYDAKSEHGSSVNSVPNHVTFPYPILYGHVSTFKLLITM